jgi:hypothetical protein
MNRKRIEELLYQALETELGGVQVYTTATRTGPRRDAGRKTEAQESELRLMTGPPMRRRWPARTAGVLQLEHRRMSGVPGEGCRSRSWCVG